ncbi:MAG: hypothetical protein LR015_00360 [Verrucomicrobia bacterium]|nr:hypothetical protein [Verrucomicrobiota bacterium]
MTAQKNRQMNAEIAKIRLCQIPNLPQERAASQAHGNVGGFLAAAKAEHPLLPSGTAYEVSTAHTKQQQAG